MAEFIKRFLQHVLPKGFAKVRHYGLDSSACGERLVAAMALLLATSVPPPNPQSQPLSSNEVPSETDDVLRCPHCRIGRLIWLGQILPSKKIPP